MNKSPTVCGIPWECPISEVAKNVINNKAYSLAKPSRCSNYLLHFNMIARMMYVILMKVNEHNEVKA